MIVLDTHVWLWWISNPEKLSTSAGQAIDQAVTEKGIIISSISTWEVALLVDKGRLEFSINVRDWGRDGFQTRLYYGIASCHQG